MAIEDDGDMSPEEARHLRFLRDEGLELIARYKKISDPKKRQLLLELADMLGNKVPPKKLDSDY